jgi:hypothetical protein
MKDAFLSVFHGLFGWIRPHSVNDGDKMTPYGG